MIIDDKLIEIKRPSNQLLWANKAKIILSVSILSLLKIEYCLKKNVLSLYFKEGLKDPLEYEANDCAVIATKIHEVMEALGVRGKYRTPSMERARRVAVKICKEISCRRRKICDQTTIEQIRELTSMYSLAAEKFAFGLDDRSKVVIQEHNNFLLDPCITRILGGLDEKPVGDDTMTVSTVSTRTSSTNNSRSLSLFDSMRSILGRNSSQKSSRSLDDSINSDNTYDSGVENEVEPVRLANYFQVKPNKRSKLGIERRVPFQRRIIV